MVALSLLALSIACYSVSQLINHGKMKWSKVNAEFWGTWSSIRKYKYIVGRIQPAPETWYYKFFKVPYKERFPLSATFLISLTDGYHLLQSLSFLSMAGCVYVLSGINFLIIWGLILLVHFTVYRLLSK